jgi:DNA-directed RNA polymerase subunit RPC12/RpoP
MAVFPDVLADQPRPIRADEGRWLDRISCGLWGHHVDNGRFARERSSNRRCRCGASYLRPDGTLTRVRHTLSCFLGHHTYRRLVDRDGQHEYVCVQCGHPLLFAAWCDPYAADAQFRKKVRYLCGLFGHCVRHVVERNGFHEYACHCGHTFLLPVAATDRVRHPARCVLSGHRIRYVTSRAGFAEYMCRDCGHPFCFVATSLSEDRRGRPAQSGIPR